MLANLPAELVIMILDYLPFNELESLSWTCSRIMQIVRRNLPIALKPRILIESMDLVDAKSHSPKESLSRNVSRLNYRAASISRPILILMRIRNGKNFIPTKIYGTASRVIWSYDLIKFDSISFVETFFFSNFRWISPLLSIGNSTEFVARIRSNFAFEIQKNGGNSKRLMKKISNYFKIFIAIVGYDYFIIKLRKICCKTKKKTFQNLGANDPKDMTRLWKNYHPLNRKKYGLEESDENYLEMHFLFSLTRIRKFQIVSAIYITL